MDFFWIRLDIFARRLNLTTEIIVCVIRIREDSRLFSNTQLSQWPFRSSVHCKWFIDQGTSSYRELTALQIRFTSLDDLQSKKSILFGPTYRSEKSQGPAPPSSGRSLKRLKGGTMVLADQYSQFNENIAYSIFAHLFGFTTQRDFLWSLNNFEIHTVLWSIHAKRRN